MTDNTRTQFPFDWSALTDPEVDLNAIRQDLAEAVRQLVYLAQEREALAADISSAGQANQLLIIGRLHGGLLPNLALSVQRTQQSLKADLDKGSLRTLIWDLIAHVNQEVECMRGIISENVTQSCKRGDLVTQLREEIRNTGRTANINLRILPDGELLDCASPEMGGVLIIFTQETIKNALTHGHASRVHVEIERKPGIILARAVDDGTGFLQEPPAGPEGLQQLADCGHLGLCILAEMAAPFGGKFNFLAKGSALGGSEVQLELQA